ncbi:MAG: RNA polymerase sigma-70 factor [Gemmatimonadales bacterium]|nr:RNA polymerase sigma-70 factor [Gemmatimonadales bacterium]
MTDLDNLDQFDSIFRTHYPSLVGFAESILRDRAAAEDVAQDVMLELWRRRKNIVLESSLRAYLLQATRNRALNHIRHQRVVGRVDPAEVAPAPTPEADHATLEEEIAAAVRQAVAGLPARCREVFELSRSQRLKHAEIASALGISVKTVEAQMGKALRTIRERLSPWLPPGGGL